MALDVSNIPPHSRHSLKFASVQFLREKITQHSKGYLNSVPYLLEDR